MFYLVLFVGYLSLLLLAPGPRYHGYVAPSTTVQLVTGTTVRVDQLVPGDFVACPMRFCPVIGYLHSSPLNFDAVHVFHDNQVTKTSNWLYVNGTIASRTKLNVVTHETMMGKSMPHIWGGEFYIDGQILVSCYGGPPGYAQTMHTVYFPLRIWSMMFPAREEFIRYDTHPFVFYLVDPLLSLLRLVADV
jgi:hypothetical protein